MESLSVGTTSPRLPFLLREQNQPGLFSREKEEDEQSLESLGVWTTSQRLPSLLHNQTQSGLFSRAKEEAENKVWRVMESIELPQPSLPCCVTRFNQGYSLERKKKQEQSLESLGVWTTSPRLPSLLHDQTQPGLFSRENEEAGKNIWSPWTSGQLPQVSLPCFVTRLNQGYSLVRRKKKRTKFGVPGRRDNFHTPLLPAA